MAIAVWEAELTGGRQVECLEWRYVENLTECVGFGSSRQCADADADYRQRPGSDHRLGARGGWICVRHRCDELTRLSHDERTRFAALGGELPAVRAETECEG